MCYPSCFKWPMRQRDSLMKKLNWFITWVLMKMNQYIHSCPTESVKLPLWKVIMLEGWMLWKNWWHCMNKNQQRNRFWEDWLNCIYHLLDNVKMLLLPRDSLTRQLIVLIHYLMLLFWKLLIWFHFWKIVSTLVTQWRKLLIYGVVFQLIMVRLVLLQTRPSWPQSMLVCLNYSLISTLNQMKNQLNFWNWYSPSHPILMRCF